MVGNLLVVEEGYSQKLTTPVLCIKCQVGPTPSITAVCCSFTSHGWLVPEADLRKFYQNVGITGQFLM